MKINQIVNINHWHPKKELSVGYGTRDKIVLKQSKMGKVYFMAKSYDKDIGELRSEVCASSIGRVFGFSVQKTWFCEIPQYKKFKLKPLGVLIQLDVRRQRYTKRNQFRENLIHGAALISNVDKNFAVLKNETERRKKYTLEVTIKAIRNYVKNNPSAKKVWEEFFELLVFDALIGGTDRHYNNWGVLEKADEGKFLRLAPAFDNGISLLWKIDEYRPRFLKEMFTRDFPRRAESMFKKNKGIGKYNLYKVLEALYSIPEYKETKVAEKILKRISRVSDAMIKVSLFKNIPLSKKFRTCDDELNLIYEYVKIRLDILNQVLYKISKNS